MFPRPFASRPDPYIKNGEFAYLFDQGRFKRIQSDHSGEGAFQFRFVLDGSIACVGFSQPYLLSIEDMRWFQETLESYGSDYVSLMRHSEPDDRLNYLLLWVDAADYYIRLQFNQELRKNLEDWFDPVNFLRQLAAVSIP